MLSRKHRIKIQKFPSGVTWYIPQYRHWFFWHSYPYSNGIDMFFTNKQGCLDFIETMRLKCGMTPQKPISTNYERL